jgi:putative transposase
MIEPIKNDDLSKVSDHLNYGWPLVTNSGLEQISFKTSRPLTPRRAGRPKLIKTI